MIIDRDGRAVSIQTKEELEKLLRDDIDAMSGEDLDVLYELLDALADEERASIAQRQIHAADYKREVVDVETFVRHPYFLGETCKDLYPVLLRDLIEIFDGDYNEIIFSGSIGLDSLIQEADGGLPTLRERIGKSGPVTVMLDHEQTTSTTEPAHTSGIKPALRLTLENGMRLDLTPDHEVRVWRDAGYAWVPAGELREGDFVVVPRVIKTEPSSDLTLEQAAALAHEDIQSGSECISDAVCRASNEAVQSYLRVLLANARMEKPFVVKRTTEGPVGRVARAVYFFRHDSERFIRQLQLLLLRFQIRTTVVFSPKYEPRRSSRAFWELRINGNLCGIYRCLTLFGLPKDREYGETFLRNTMASTMERYSHRTMPLKYGAVRTLLKKAGARVPKTSPMARKPRSEESVRRGAISRMYRGLKLPKRAKAALDDLCAKFYEEVGFERVASIRHLTIDVPVGDIGAHNGNRFLANGMSVHNSIGFGKTFVCSIGVCYVLYQLSCMHDPAASFNLAPETPITVIGLSASEDLAKEVVLKNVIGKIGTSKYFRENYKPRITQRNIRFPNGVTVWARATTPRSALGMSPICALVDEIDFMPRRRKKSQQRFGVVNMSKEIYDSITRRLTSRFGSHGKLFLPCSKTVNDSFLGRRIKEAEKDPTVFVRDYALWEAKPGDYSDRKFWVLCGNEQIPSRILPDDEIESVRENQPERTTLLDVPIDFRPKFESDLEGSIRDLGGVATVSFSPFIQRRQKVYEMEDPARKHPFSVPCYRVGQTGHFLWDEFTEEHISLDADGRPIRVRRPKHHPEMPRHVHIDPALNQCSAGLCMSHQFGTTTVSRRDKAMNLYPEEAPLFVVDLVLEIVPPVGEELEFAMYRQIIYDLSKHGFPVVGVSMDGYQSVDALQILADRGYHTSKISMDRTWDPYQHAKSALYEGRVRCYHHPVLFRQLQKLEADWERRKIQAPDGELKDVADAFAGSLYGVYHMPAYFPLPLVVGNSSFRVPLGKVPEHERPKKIVAMQPGASIEAQIANNSLLNEVGSDSPIVNFFRSRGLW